MIIPSSDLKLLADILDSIHRIETYTKSGIDDFVASHLIQDAVIRNFEIIGEAANKLSDSTIQLTAERVSWRKIINFRNVLIHNYSGVDIGLVWNTIERDIPQLKNELQNLIG